MIKVSVIIPVYKVPLKYLRECLNSLARQTFRECEFIIISDGAPNEERSVCKENAQRDKRFKFFERDHLGVSSAKNFGIKQATGEYITFVDSDDWVEQDFLTITFDTANSQQLEILNWDYRLQNINQKKQVKPLINHPIRVLNKNQINLFLNNILINQDYGQSLSSCCTRLYKLSFIKDNNILFNENLTIGEDKAFNYQSYLYCKRAGYLNKTFYNYRMRSDSTVHQYIPNSLPIYLKYIDYIASFCRSQNQESLGKEFLNVFFHSLNYSYFPQNTTISVSQSVSQLQKTILSDKFQRNLPLVTTNKHSFSIRIYLYCLRHKILIPIYIRALRHLIHRKLQCLSNT